MNKKELIRIHAIKVIARDGFYSAKVKSIADEAGIAAGTVYLYFKNKEDILDYIFSVEHHKRAEFIMSLYHKEAPIDEVIEQFIRFNFDCYENEPDTTKVIIREASTVFAISGEKAKNAIDEAYNAFKNILERERENKRIKESINIEMLAPFILNFIRSSSYNILTQGEADNYKNMIDCLKNFILFGIMN